MGFIYDSHGRSEIAAEKRGESFILHPAYGYEIQCPTCHGEPLMGGNCRECDGEGRVGFHADSAFGKWWQESGHPEFLLEDVSDIIRALADLPTCPQIVKEAVEEDFQCR